MMLASVVFPQPGGPRKYQLPNLSVAIARRSSECWDTICFCPINSSRLLARIRSAKGLAVSSLLLKSNKSIFSSVGKREKRSRRSPAPSVFVLSEQFLYFRSVFHPQLVSLIERIRKLFEGILAHVAKLGLQPEIDNLGVLLSSPRPCGNCPSGRSSPAACRRRWGIFPYIPFVPKRLSRRSYPRPFPLIERRAPAREFRRPRVAYCLFP